MTRNQGLPKIMAPAARKRFTTPASSETTDPRRLKDSEVVFIPEREKKSDDLCSACPLSEAIVAIVAVELMTNCLQINRPSEEQEFHANKISFQSVFVLYPMQHPVSMKMGSVLRLREALVLQDWFPRFVKNRSDGGSGRSGIMNQQNK